MARGAKPGERRGGREKGTPNKRTREREEQMAAASAALEKALANPFTGDSHALLMAIYKKSSIIFRLSRWILSFSLRKCRVMEIRFLS